MQETKTQEVMEPETKGAEENLADTPTATGDTPPAPRPGDIEYTRAVSERIGKEKEKARLAEERARQAEEKVKQLAEEVEFWRRKAEEGGKSESSRTPEKPKWEETAFSEPEPQEQDFDNYGDYIKALASWQYRKDKAIDTARAASRRAAEQAEKALRKFEEGAKVVREEHPDFDEMIRKPIFTEAMSRAIYLSEKGPQIAYYLGKNPSVADRLATLTSDEVFLEIGKLEKELTTPAKKTVSEAPPPITPVSGETATEKTPLHELPMEEYAKRRNKEVNF